MATFKDEIMDGLQYAIEHHKNLNQLALASDVSQANLFNWVHNKKSPNLDKVSTVMDYLGAHVVFPWSSPDAISDGVGAQIQELHQKIKELNEQIVNYRVITESYRQLLAKKK